MGNPILNKKLGAICIEGKLVYPGNPIVISLSSIDERILGYEKAGLIRLVRGDKDCRVFMQ